MAGRGTGDKSLFEPMMSHCTDAYESPDIDKLIDVFSAQLIYNMCIFIVNGSLIQATYGTRNGHDISCSIRYLICHKHISKIIYLGFHTILQEPQNVT